VIATAREIAILKGALTALEHKKAALENLSRLYLSGYWADPKVTGEVKDKYNDNSQEAHRSHLENNESIGRHV
jgi:hypothetical protein